MKLSNSKSRMRKINTQPGTVAYTGDKPLMQSYIELISYNEKEITRKNISIQDILKLNKNSVNWINVVGVNDIELIKNLGSKLEIDTLVLEDITTIGARPKYENLNNYRFIITELLLPELGSNLFRVEQLSIYIKENILITFQEVKEDVFESVRFRIKNNQGIIRKSGTAYLLYSLLDTIVDQYFVVVNELDRKIEILEDEVLNNAEKQHSKKIYTFRRNIMELRNTVWPISETIKNLKADESLFSKSEVKYLNDLTDNIKQVMDSISTYRDLTMGLYEIYLSNISNKMNRIMTTLTIISVIFIPLTFLSSVYGMNFRHIPELELAWGYYGFWGLCILLFLALILFFKKKDWFF